MPVSHRRWILPVFLSTVFFIAPVTAQVQPEAPPVPLRFAPGQTEVEVRGTVTGYQTQAYTFDSNAGGNATVRLDHKGQASLYFNVAAPSGATIFNGSMDGPRFQAILRERGRYQVSVYLMRNDARRSKQVPFTLRINQSASNMQQPLPPHADGPSFDCSRARGVIETAICRSPALSELDGRLDFVYRDALAGAGPRHKEAIRNDQRQWLNARASCARESALERCLTRHYLARISRLEPKR